MRGDRSHDVVATPMSARVLIVEDGDTPYVEPVVEAFRREGWHVGRGLPGGGSGGGRGVSFHAVPPPEHGEEEFARAVTAAIQDGGYDLVFGADDVEMLALSAVRERLPCPFPYAPHEAVVAAVDKLTLAGAAERVGLGSPRTWPATPETMAAVELPVAVKSRLHWTPGSAADERHLLVTFATDRDAIRAAVDGIAAAGGQAILQEPIDGQLMAVSTVVADDGRAIAWSQQQTLRSSLRRTSARAETVALDPGLAERVSALMDELGWRGLANLQFLRREGDEPRLIDLNGRYYGSIELAIAAGANLPVVWARSALGATPAEPVLSRPGVRWQRLRTDLRRARAERRGGLVRDVADTLAFAPRAALSRRA